MSSITQCYSSFLLSHIFISSYNKNKKHVHLTLITKKLLWNSSTPIQNKKFKKKITLACFINFSEPYLIIHSFYSILNPTKMQPRDRNIQDGLLVSAVTTNKARRPPCQPLGVIAHNSISAFLFLITFSISATPLSDMVLHSIKRYTKVKGKRHFSTYSHIS